MILVPQTGRLSNARPQGLFAVTAVMVVLDYLFLGYLARGVYKRLLGPLLGETVLWAAVLFYLQYVAVIIGFAVLPLRLSSRPVYVGSGLVGSPMRPMNSPIWQ